MSSKYDKVIGIMSMQRVANYGSYLQAYGLMTTLKKIGYKNIEFVDYKFEKDIIPDKKESKFKKFLKNPSFIDRKKRNDARKKFKEAYKGFLNGLGVSNKYNYNETVDTLVIGSDEVFNCMQHYPVGYSRALFGRGYEKSNVISYAASFGHTTLCDLKNKKIDKEVGEMLSKFRALSVRDENSEMIVEKITNKSVLRHLDPVLISEYPDIEVNVPYKNYIIVYAYQNRLTRSEEKEIRKFAKKHHKIILSLGFYQRCADYNLIVEPLEVFAYFKNADFIITDTFHGTIFSIKTNNKFCTLVRESNKNKLMSLMKSLHCESQIVDDIKNVERIYGREIDFERCNDVIKKETKRAVAYLSENI